MQKLSQSTQNFGGTFSGNGTAQFENLGSVLEGRKTITPIRQKRGTSKLDHSGVNLVVNPEQDMFDPKRTLYPDADSIRARYHQARGTLQLADKNGVDLGSSVMRNYNLSPAKSSKAFKNIKSKLNTNLPPEVPKGAGKKKVTNLASLVRKTDRIAHIELNDWLNMFLETFKKIKNIHAAVGMVTDKILKWK
jgi:hypothetical protein